MKNLRKNIIFIIVIFFTLSIKSQSLEPNKSIFEIFDFQFEYYSKLRTKLFKNLADNPKIRLVINESFSLESVFQIEKSENGYVAKVNTVNKSVYYTKDLDSVSLIEFNSKINSSDVELLSKVYQKIIANTHHRYTNMIGLDGGTYNFSVWDFGLKSGVIWSPNDSVHKSVIDVTKILIKDISSNRKNVSLSSKNRKTLLKVYQKLNEGKKIQDYNVMIKIKENLEANKQYYFSKISEDKREKLEEILIDCERELLIEFAVSGYNKQRFIDIINYRKQQFEGIMDESFDSLVDEKFLSILEDNIFIKLIKSLN
jgi:hypothetical protein